MEPQKKRKPFVALIFSFLTLGLGQLYNGQLKRGVILYLSGLLVFTILISSGLFATFRGMIVCLAFAIGFFLFVMFDALYNAIRLKEIQIRSFNRWYIYLIIILINSFAINPLITSSIPFKAYKMPAGSMEPTLFIGDHFIVSKACYKNKKPERKDIVVFRYPVDPRKDFIKRVIGIEGDTIQIINKNVYVNGKLFPDPPGMQHTDPRILPGRDNMEPVTVPKDKIFVMGDNRDQSYDSRFWKFVPLKDVKGKALYIYWAKTKDRIGIELK